MITKDQICEAFCREVEVRAVPIGLAVSTPFNTTTDDAIGFYIKQEPNSGHFTIVDDGTSVAVLEALGVNLRGGTRKEVFQTLLDEYGLLYDTDGGEIHTGPLAEKEVASAALRFVGGMLRLQDLGLLHPRTVESTFREDANKALDEKFHSFAEVRHDAIVSEKLENYEADSLIETKDSNPVAIYYGTSNNRINEAVLLWMEARLILKIPTWVILLLETARTTALSERALARAYNHLDHVAVFRGQEESALEKISSYVRGDIRLG